MYVVINSKTKQIVSGPHCYQDAAKVGNELDQQFGGIVHSACHTTAIRDHELRFGQLTDIRANRVN